MHSGRNRLDSDSDDEPVGLPGDRAAAKPSPPRQRAEEAAVPQKPLGFEIEGFGNESGKQAAPSEALLARLSRKTAPQSKTKKKKKPSDSADARREKRKADRIKKSQNDAPRTTGIQPNDDDDDDSTQNDTVKTNGSQPHPIGVAVGVEEAPADLPPPADLSPEDRKECANLISLVGEDLVKMLRSSRWQHRCDGLKELQGNLPSYPSGKHKLKVFELCVAHIAWAINDSVYQVYQTCLALWSHLVDVYAVDIPPAAVRERVAVAIPPLIGRLGDINGRVRDAAHNLLLDLARSQRVGVDFIASYATTNKELDGTSVESECASEPGSIRSSDGETASGNGAQSPPPAVPGNVSHWPSSAMGKHTVNLKLLIGRLNLCLALVQEHSLRSTGPLSVPSVMAVAVEGLQTSNFKVRKTASSVVVEVYRRHGKNTEMYLQNLSSALLKQLKQEIEIELCDVDALEGAETKGEEEDDLAMLEPGLVEGLSAEQQEQVNKWKALLGCVSLVCVFSKKWKLRDRLVNRLRAKCEGVHAKYCEDKAAGRAVEAQGIYDPSSYQITRGAFEAFIEICEIVIQDSIPQLVVDTTLCLKSVLQLYGEMIAAKDLRWCFANVIMPKCVAHTSSQTSIVTQACHDLLLDLAKHPKIGPGFMSNFVMQPDHSRSGKDWKLALAKMNILLLLIPHFEFDENGLSTEGIMSYAVGGFQSPNGKVRSAAVNVIIEVYKKCGNVIRAYLRNQRPALLQDLKEKLTNIARKDRTKSAPIQTLASIVQPLAVEDELDKYLPSRPSTFPVVIEADELRESEPVSMKMKIAKWKAEQGDGEGQPVSKRSSVSSVEQAPTTCVQTSKAPNRGRLVFN